MSELILCLCTCGVLFGYTRGRGWIFQFLTDSLIGTHRSLGYVPKNPIQNPIHQEISKRIKI